MIHPVLAVGNYAAWIYEQNPEEYERFAKRCRFAVFAHASICNWGQMVRRAKGQQSSFYYGQVFPSMHHKDKRRHLRKYLFRLFGDKSNPHYADMQELLKYMFDSDLYDNVYHEYESAIEDLTQAAASIYASVYQDKIGLELERFCDRRDTKLVTVNRYHQINVQPTLHYKREICVFANNQTSMNAAWSGSLQKYCHIYREGLYLAYGTIFSLTELYGLLIGDERIGDDNLRQFIVRRDFTLIEVFVMIRRLFVLLGGRLYV